MIKIASPNGEAIQKAYDMIHSIVAEPENPGGIYKGKVVKIVDFGAFGELLRTSATVWSTCPRSRTGA